MNASAAVKPNTDWTMEEAFPEIDPGRAPLGSAVIVQIRQPKKKSRSIILTEDTRDTEKANTQIAKVVAIGKTCFCDQKTLEPWPEGPWFQVGDFVSIPLYVGDRWWRQVPGKVGDDGKTTFCLVGHLDIRAKITGNPLDEIVTV